MSRGTKWAIGLGAVFILLLLASCVAAAALLSKGGGTSLASGDGVAVIHIDGVIQGGSSGSGSPEYVLDQLDRALKDSGVKAIVLRIDSPGGTVAASQEMMLGVKRAAARKPVVVSVGDMCASGGYMVASQATEIVAAPGSSVGSIGVIMELTNVEGLLNKVGVKFTTLTEGEFKDAGSPYRSATATETAMMRAQLSKVYDQFIKDVARGRKLPESKVRELATGWVWLGSEALDLGLVDKLGNYDDAVRSAAKRGGIKGDPRIVTYESADPFTTLLNNLTGLKSSSNALDSNTLRRLNLPR